MKSLRRQVSSSEIGERVSTGVRLRPWLAHEKASGDVSVKIEQPNCITLLDPLHQTDRVFQCDFVFDSNDKTSDDYADQQAVYDAVGMGIVESAVNGHNACLCAYGQTGTGKTHTVVGNMSVPDERGLLPRIAYELFAKLDRIQAAGGAYTVQLSYIEIYNNRLRDLLAPAASSARARAMSDDVAPSWDRAHRSADLKIHTHPDIGVYVENLSEHAVTNFGEVTKLIIQAEKERLTAMTAMNRKSSRSHTICLIKVDIRCSAADGGNRMATVQVVDLAGRENEQTSECIGDRMKELTFINRELFQLANCVNALSTDEEHVPFRNSKLTLLLSESFKRNSRTCLLATLSPNSSAYNENLMTCTFLESTGRIKTWPVANRFSPEDVQEQLTDELTQMRSALGLPALGPSFDPASGPYYSSEQSDAPEVKSREALLTHFGKRPSEEDTPGIVAEHHADGKHSLLSEAYSHAGKSLNAAQGSLGRLEQANASIGESLGKAESFLSSMETRVKRMAAHANNEAQQGVKLPPLVPPKVPVTISMEMPEFLEFVPLRN